ncbi:MAG: response regulator [Bacteroidetes bacterium]|nr:response regulator [Bacteroidota bacterium]
MAKWKDSDDLTNANKEIAFQEIEREKRAAELILANAELIFQNAEKEKRAAELIIANRELIFQTAEKGKRAAELVIANKELAYQEGEKKKRAEELIIANYARSLIEASRDPLFTISPQGKITDINQATIRVTGVVREKLIGSDFINYFTEPNKAREGYEEVFANGFVSDYSLIVKDHEFTDVLFNGSIYKDDKGDVIGAVMVARDITEQKRTEKELIESKIFAELATEFAEEAKLKAEKAAIIANDAVKSKQQFLSNMSHEIRTPLNAIIGFTKVVLKSKLTDKQTEYLNAIKISGDALIVLINDILDLAKVDAGKMTYEVMPFKIASSIFSMTHLFEPKIQEKNLELIRIYDEKIPEVLLGDSVRLHQIIINLISNAVKFTNKGSITVKVQLVELIDDSAVIKFSISDTGIGIPKNRLEKIFENFQQASSSTSRIFGGTGLGLAIVKQLVESQGGTIGVESEILEGSTFSFILKFKVSTEKLEIESNNIVQDSEIKNIKVLVVEDIALNQLLMKTLLDDFGFERDIASNGKIAIEKLKDKEYDIILMDLQMPEMNGFEATEYIRNVMNSKIPIIALTADVTTVDLEKCKAVGMDDYIAKPVDDKVLYAKIIGLVIKPDAKRQEGVPVVNAPIKEVIRHTNLTYLIERTKANPALMSEMISLYLEQTPPLILTMKQSFEKKDWHTLHAAIHKMIPSFSIVGINKEFEEMAKKILTFATAQEEMEGVQELILKVENACTNACKELKEELNKLNYNK